MSSFRVYSLRRKPCVFCHSSSLMASMPLSLTASSFQASDPLRSRSSCLAPFGSMSPSPTFARAGAAAPRPMEAKRAAATVRRDGWESPSPCCERRSCSCCSTAAFVCSSSSLLARIFSRAIGFDLSMNWGVIFLIVDSSWPVMNFSCFSRRLCSCSISTSFSGTGMSISSSSFTIVRTDPSGVSPRPAKSLTSTFVGSARVSQATAGISAFKASK
mmetsp:Transcript_83519/g.215091  ORF Transcript_83519/g.215091 Transcript_83519/m.215091 type:complete len:216 (+) Transcript_83519:432-1079(+)